MKTVLGYLICIPRAILLALIFWRPRIVIPKDFTKIEAIVGVAMGSCERSGKINKSNYIIATLLVDVLRDNHTLLRVFQWEAATIVRQLYQDYNFRLLFMDNGWMPHIETWAFFEKLRAEYPNMKAIMIVAHPDHIRRCCMIARKFGFEPYIAPGIPAIKLHRDSSHWWTRDWIRFFLHERCAIFWYALQGKI